jgi:pyruvate/2-oxoglutarate dehydrogenase complex dihydrolipoamide dehydrogenase (E3) component
MAVEFDLVVIGNNTAAISAAVAAARLQARVALVAPQLDFKANLESVTKLELSSIFNQALAQAAGVAYKIDNAANDCIYPGDDSTNEQSSTLSQLNTAWDWAKAVVSTIEEQHSLAVLASLGVDVVAGNGEFCRRPHLAFVVKNRHLRARAYLIATNSRLAIPYIDGLETTGYLTAANFHQSFPQKLPQSWIVIGNGAVATEISQTLVRLGVSVTLVVRGARILPQEDLEISQLLQAQLEAEGVRILTETKVEQVKRIDSKKWVLAGNKAIEVDEILLAAGSVPNTEGLNLEGVGVKINQRGLQLNEKLQTTNPRIYGCRDVIKGYHFPHLADYEAKVALKNALFFTVFKVNYRGIPAVISTDPQLARVGITEAQAIRRYGKDVMVLRQYFQTVSKAIIMGETTGLCKILVRRNGEILGAAIVGAEAGELMSAIALAMRQKLKISAIADSPHISPTMSEIVTQTAAEWNQLRLSNNTFLQDLLENFFNVCRSWSS